MNFCIWTKKFKPKAWKNYQKKCKKKMRIFFFTKKYGEITTSRSINSIFQIKIYFLIFSIETLECILILNTLFSTYIFFFIYFLALCLSKPSWVEHRYDVAAVSKCHLKIQMKCEECETFNHIQAKHLWSIYILS